MPFLRVIRDKRGYETTYLLHWYREGGRQHSRILYVFRTPQGVRVGRSALDPQVIGEIEERYPDIAFDWAVVRENQQMVEPPPAEQRRRRPRREDADAPAPASSPASLPAPASAPVSVTEGVAAVPAVPAAPPPAPGPAADAPPPLPPPMVPDAIEGETPDEQMAFLAHWYPILRDRVPQRTADPARTEALLALAERLNPAGWTDADQIVTGLQLAAESLERLSHVFSRRRRRPRRRPGSDRSATPIPDPPQPPE